jgi:uncharacterized protein
MAHIDDGLLLPDILGSGLDYPYTLPMGLLKFVESAQSVEAAVRMVLTTPKGSRFMLPQYGSDLPYLLFEPCDETTGMRATVYATEAVNTWIPRVRQVRARYELVPASHLIRLYIEYQLIHDPTPLVMVYPLYLQTAS